jgi:hypothetical protein
MDSDIPSLFGLPPVYSCTPQLPPSSRILAHIRERYWVSQVRRHLFVTPWLKVRDLERGPERRELKGSFFLLLRKVEGRGAVSKMIYLTHFALIPITAIFYHLTILFF